MQIKYRINERDYRNAAMLELKKRSRLSRLEYYSPYAFAIIWIAASLFPSAASEEFDSTDLVLTLGILPILMGFLYLRRKKFRGEYQKLRDFHLLQTLDMDGIGLRTVTTQGTSRSSWQLFTTFAEDPKSFILFKVGGHGFLPIPKHHLTVNQNDELRALLVARLPSE